MKTFTYGIITFISFLLINTAIIEKEHVVLLKDVNTNNISEIIKEEDLPNVKKICSYNFCDYIRGKNLKSSMEIFIKKYLKKQPQDDEIKKTIYVKGLKITKIIYYS